MIYFTSDLHNYDFMSIHVEFIVFRGELKLGDTL